MALTPREEIAALQSRVALVRRSLTADGALPQVLKPSEVVLVTGLSEYSVRYRLDSGSLISDQLAKHGQRYVPIEAVEELCIRLGILPNWEPLLK